jgi:hypothetical protein
MGKKRKRRMRNWGKNIEKKQIKEDEKQKTGTERILV